MFKRLILFATLAACMMFGGCIGFPGLGVQEEILKGSTEVEMSMGEFAFRPERITVPAGEQITLTLSNSGAAPHDFTIMASPAEAPFDAADEKEIYYQAALAAGEGATLTFTAPAAPGEYQIVSSLPGDLEEGMTATLVVVQP